MSNWPANICNRPRLTIRFAEGYDAWHACFVHADDLRNHHRQLTRFLDVQFGYCYSFDQTVKANNQAFIVLTTIGVLRSG
ncbi:MAG: hypothetical protein ACI9UN_005141 [Granulosicoccus sp.]|jgi:hypothetical protein